MRNPLLALLGIPASLMILTIRVYQRTLSPDHGPLKTLFPYGYCRHTPTCSEYVVDALKHRSLPVAVALTVKRLLSCNPWTPPSDARLREAINRT